jgi:ABC-2 type transport system ATP-binding protein
VDPVSRREFWDALAHLAADGLTILLATPYLDEAERCHRVALMHQGEIHDMGTPGELRERLGAQRMEVHTSNLAVAEEVLSPLAGTGREILDVQRFGDRLDLLAPRPAAVRVIVEEHLRAAGLQVQEILLDDPTLENTFVARLRALGQEVHDEPFPGRHDYTQRALYAPDRSGGDRSLAAHPAVWILYRSARCKPGSPLRRDLWTLRGKWGRKNHHYQDAVWLSRTDSGGGATSRMDEATAIERSTPEYWLHVAEILLV